MEQAKDLLAALQSILELHHPDFPAAQPPVAPPPPEPDRDAINARHRKAALAGIGMFERRARAQAKAAAEMAASAEIAAAIAKNQRLHAQYQTDLDRLWQRLLQNDPEIVLGTLAEAFEDNDAAAAPVGVAGSEASLVVLVPTSAAIPERRPATTSAGNLTLKKLTKREIADFYKLMVCGYVLATVKEAFAVAPGLTHTSIVALRDDGPDAYGHPRVEAILAARFARQALRDVRWTTADAVRIVSDASELLTVKQAGASKEFAPLDLDSEPDIAKVVQAVDVSDLLS
ncbi:hypothetical protein [Actinopolymorpha pittospori]|uniref:Uncharacterized protein n=1 Tax=Actinopolymorpha pittospori TaxID=648752 RepID=A0A927MV34_9ACTN|nr:hypothetical protein [Actinopolymorpha pittospori]MBE1603852.1 hypothetical protein [Actinopolymorpha pittospori]